MKYYCDCKIQATQRTVIKEENGNKGRTILFCGNDNQCKMIVMLPLCYCNKSAGIGFKNDGARYYKCFKGQCKFKDWNVPNASPTVTAGIKRNDLQDQRESCKKKLCL